MAEVVFKEMIGEVASGFLMKATHSSVSFHGKLIPPKAPAEREAFAKDLFKCLAQVLDEHERLRAGLLSNLTQ